MTAALALLGYAVVAAWAAPVLLRPLTGAPFTTSPAGARWGLATWLTAMASAVASASLGTVLIANAAAADWPTVTSVLCHEVAGTACTPQVYRSALYSAGVAVLAAGVTLAALAALWRYGRRTRRAVASSRLHARAAWLAGRELAGTGAVVLDDPRPVAYCVAGRPAAIVVSSGALAVLDSPQLAAVLAHERAHLASRHHLLATVTRGLSAAFPGVPLFAAGADAVARLAELAADDTAARTTGRSALVTALLAIATGSAVPVARGALAAAGYAVPARVERLLSPPPARRAAATAVLALAAVSLALLAVPAVLAGTALL